MDQELDVVYTGLRVRWRPTNDSRERGPEELLPWNTSVRRH